MKFVNHKLYVNFQTRQEFLSIITAGSVIWSISSLLTDLRDWGHCVGGLMCISGPLWHSPDDFGHKRQGHLFHESAFPEVEHLVTDGGWCKWKKTPQQQLFITTVIQSIKSFSLMRIYKVLWKSLHVTPHLFICCWVKGANIHENTIYKSWGLCSGESNPWLLVFCCVFFIQVQFYWISGATASQTLCRW